VEYNSGSNRSRVYKLDECEVQGWFEITSTITPWIVQQEVQLLIICNHIYYKWWNWKFITRISLERKRLTLFKQREGSYERAHNWCIITWLSNDRYPGKKSSNRITVIGHPRDCTLITIMLQNRCTEYQSQSRILLYIRLKIKLHRQVFQKAKIAWAAMASAISALWKPYKWKLLPH